LDLVPALALLLLRGYGASTGAHYEQHSRRVRTNISAMPPVLTSACPLPEDADINAPVVLNVKCLDD
jgi:hypothetical protein